MSRITFTQMPSDQSMIDDRFVQVIHFDGAYDQSIDNRSQDVYGDMEMSTSQLTMVNMGTFEETLTMHGTIDRSIDIDRSAFDLPGYSQYSLLQGSTADRFESTRISEAGVGVGFRPVALCFFESNHFRIVCSILL